MANQATENLFNAVDEIINARLQSLNYDTTIKAVIVNADQANRGIYTVAEIGAEQTNKFEAHSENTSYQCNDCVYVTIPRGDAAAENKIIIGKYVEDGDAYYNYINPMDSFLDITGNLIQSLDANSWKLTANYEPISRIDIWNAQNLNLRGFDRLALKAQFKTWLESLDIMSGNYGLVLIIEDAKGEFSTFSLTTKEMYGNPYCYETYYEQEILLDIGAIEEIKAMYLTLFQANDFFTSQGELASGTEEGKKIPENIFMKAPYISVGYDISNFDGDDLRIYSSDELSYDCTQDPVEKTIEAKWIHVAEGVSAIAVDHESEMPRNPDWNASPSGTNRYPQPETKADLTWYQWDKNASGTMITGKNWSQIESALNSFSYTFQTDTSEEGTTIPAMRFKAMVEVPSLRYVNAQFAATDTYKNLVNSDNVSATYMECLDIFHDIMDNTLTQNDGRKQISEKHTNNNEFDDDSYGNMIKALNEYLTMRSEIKYVQSAELTFVNLGYSPEKYATDNIAELEVIVDPGGLKGQYLIYDDTGMITNPSEAEQTRYCEAVYKTLAGVLHDVSSNDDFKYEVDDTERICWYIPLDSTMIATPVEGIDYTAYDTVVKEYIVDDPNNAEGLPLGRYCKIERIPQRDKTEIDEDALIAEHHMYSRQNFKIKDYYTQMETNNIIYCRVTKRNKFYMGRGMMTFGVAGTNGTDSTFILRLFEVGDDDASLSDIPASALSVNTYRYSEDKDGNIVTRFSPTPGKLIVVPELYDYNNKLIENYFTDHDVTYRIVTWTNPNNPSDTYSEPFRLDRHVAGESKMTLTWSGLPAGGLDNINNDFYLVLEAEVPYKIVYEFETYTQDDLNNEPALIDLGKKVGDYKLDADGNKIPTGNTREDKLKTYLPISIVKDKLLKRTVKVENPTVQVQPNDINLRDYFRQIIGANKVIYDRNGSNAKYYKDPYQLLNGLLEEVEGVTWYARIRASDGKTGSEKASIESFYPTVSPAGDETGQKLVPLEMFILGNSIAENFCVYGKKDGHVVCVQPVLIMQNKYGSSMLNKWDGGLTIDEKNGTILASMVGAGIKDENNTFSGVLMGDITQAFDDNQNGLGLYGFHQNDQSFGFNIDGTAFIGKAGHGRIWFDGINGTISSGAYSDGISPSFKYLGTGHNGEAPIIRPQQGMEIDLDGSDGISSSLKMFGPMGGLVIDTKERQLDDYWKNGGKIHIPTENDPDPRTITFKLFTGIYKNKEVPDTSKGEFQNTSLPYERGMIYFDNDGQYIQSTNYDGKYNNTGTHTARLNALKPIGKNVKIKFGEYPAGLNGQTIPPGWNVWKLNNKGKVEAEPISYNDTPAQQGSFIDLQNGWIDMRNGIVGGWQISKDMIASRLGEIIMWSGDPSDNSDAGIPFIRIGAVQNNEMKGKLWIADYRILGKTVVNGSVGTYVLDNTGEADLNNDGYEEMPTDLAEDDSAGAKVEKLTYLKTTITAGSFTTGGLNSWSLYDDTENNASQTLGTILETAVGSGPSSGKSIIVWRPTNNNAITSLGTTTYPWDNIYANNGIFLEESFTGSKEWHLVATQDWVAKVVVKVLNDRIKEVNNLAAKALSTANTALKKARTAIANILTWCAEWNGKQIVKDVKLAPFNLAHAISYDYYTVTAVTDKKGNLTGSVELTEGYFQSTPVIWGATIHIGDNGSLHELAGGGSWSSSTKISDTVNTIEKGINKLAEEIATIKTQMSGATATFTGTKKTISMSDTISIGSHRHEQTDSTYTKYSGSHDATFSDSVDYTPEGTITINWGSSS